MFDGFVYQVYQVDEESKIADVFCVAAYALDGRLNRLAGG